MEPCSPDHGCLAERRKGDAIGERERERERAKTQKFGVMGTVFGIVFGTYIQNIYIYI